MLSQVFLMSPAYFEYALSNVPKVAGRGTVHVGPTVQLNAAHVLVANPDVHVGRFESVLSSVDHEAELPPHRYGRHSKSLKQGITLLISIVAPKGSADNVSYNDTANQIRNNGARMPLPSKTCSQLASARRWISRLLASLAIGTWAYP